MTPQTIAEVRTSFRVVAENPNEVAAVFYRNLFAADPALRQLFPEDLSAQKRKLMQALSLAVDALDRPDALFPVLRGLGARHAGYGVRPSHYATVGKALLATLAAGLGGAFTPACRDAWAETYALVAATMQDGATG